MKTCWLNAKKIVQITSYFFEDVRDPLLFAQHLRCKTHGKVIEPVFGRFYRDVCWQKKWLTFQCFSP